MPFCAGNFLFFFFRINRFKKVLEKNNSVLKFGSVVASIISCREETTMSGFTRRMTWLIVREPCLIWNLRKLYANLSICVFIIFQKVDFSYKYSLGDSYFFLSNNISNLKNIWTVPQFFFLHIAVFWSKNKIKYT